MAIFTFSTVKTGVAYVALTAGGRVAENTMKEIVDKNRLDELPLWEGDYLFLRLIADPNQPFFSMKMRYQGDHLVEASLSGRPLAF